MWFKRLKLKFCHMGEDALLLLLVLVGFGLLVALLGEIETVLG